MPQITITLEDHAKGNGIGGVVIYCLLDRWAAEWCNLGEHLDVAHFFTQASIDYLLPRFSELNARQSQADPLQLARILQAAQAGVRCYLGRKEVAA